MPDQDSRRPMGGSQPTREQIAERAYTRYVERGSEPGHDLEDWLEAERELRAPEGGKADEPKPGGRRGGRKSAA